MGHPRHLPTDRDSELHHPPAAQFQQVCVLKDLKVYAAVGEQAAPGGPIGPI